MESCPGSEFTVVELKEALRERGLSTSGTKIELIRRLNDDGSMGGARGAAEGCPVCGGPRGSRGRAAADGGRRDGRGDGESRRAQEECADVAAFEGAERDDATRMELMFLRREKQLWERGAAIAPTGVGDIEELFLGDWRDRS